MIDMGLLELMRQVLEVSTADVNEARETLLEEQRSADARYAASSALMHPEGSTTPINEAYSRAQDRVADLRAKALKEVPTAFRLLLALQVAEERRTEALRHRDMMWKQADAKDALGVDPAVADWFARLHNHGVHPHHLKQQAAEMVAIIADLVTWKAKDAKFRNPDNPWRAVLQVYATRRIGKPTSRKRKADRSVPGTPTRNRHIRDMGDYMFNELVSAAWTTETSAPVTAQAEKEAVSATSDCSVYPDDHDKPAGDGEPVYVEGQDRPEGCGEATTIPDRSDGELTPARAQAVAEVIVDRHPFHLPYYWPKEGVTVGDLDPTRLVPALQAWVDRGDAWLGAHHFLAAAMRGTGAEFIEDRRRHAVEKVMQGLLDGDQRAVDDAREVGIDVVNAA